MRNDAVDCKLLFPLLSDLANHSNFDYSLDYSQAKREQSLTNCRPRKLRPQKVGGNTSLETCDQLTTPSVECIFQYEMLSNEVPTLC